MKHSRYLLAAFMTLSVLGANDASAQARAGQRRSLNVERGWLGFAWNPATVRVNDENRPATVIEEIVANSPAARAGLEQGDTVIAINGLRVTERFMSTLAETLQPGDEVRVRVRSSGRDRELTLTAHRRVETPLQLGELLLAADEGCGVPLVPRDAHESTGGRRADVLPELLGREAGAVAPERLCDFESTRGALVRLLGET